MPGAVYVYNLFNEPARLSLNGGLALSPSGADASRLATMGDAASGYRPSFTEVGSAVHNDQDTGLFYRGGTGVNDLKIQWDSGTGSTATFLMPTLAENVSVDDDLLCYITTQFAIVLNTKGSVLKNNSLDFAIAMR
ncbi:MAG: hypothetical protein JOZ96_28915 [Acidobacteria bacterium]|nr:hypothetical protein [Acidobacteriota bacterium]